jgi:hypothetical protein
MFYGRLFADFHYVPPRRSRLSQVVVHVTPAGRAFTEFFPLPFVSLCTQALSLIKADSHIACRAHAIPMQFPCHYVPLIHKCRAAPLPCSDSAVSFVKVHMVAGNI